MAGTGARVIGDPYRRGGNGPRHRIGQYRQDPCGTRDYPRLRGGAGASLQGRRPYRLVSAQQGRAQQAVHGPCRDRRISGQGHVLELLALGCARDLGPGVQRWRPEPGVAGSAGGSAPSGPPGHLSFSLGRGRGPACRLAGLPLRPVTSLRHAVGCPPGLPARLPMRPSTMELPSSRQAADTRAMGTIGA
jgi:hypothetical protein